VEIGPELVDAYSSITTGELVEVRRMIEAGETGRLPAWYNYSGAHTHRLSGANKLNLQNLTNGSTLRESIEAPKGHKIVVADSSQIEARVNAKASGERFTLAAFRDYDAGTGPDIYKLMAADIFRVPVDKVDKKQRTVGKVAELGLGFRMGPPKFKHSAATGRDKVVLSEDEAKRIVQLYRRKHHGIVKAWKDLDDILVNMHRMGPEDEDTFAGFPYGRGWFALPNGLFLQYPGMSIDDDGEVTYNSLYRRVNIHGGKLLENIVQALARVIVFEQMRIISKRYHVAMTTHDEVVAIVPDPEVDESKEWVRGVMSTPPAWWPDLPLNCTVEHDQCYSK
jgi:DNA polymerase